MRKTLFAIMACCFAASTAFAQLTLEVRLTEEKPQDEAAIMDINEFEHGRIFIKINGEPDDKGRTPVQIELENNSDVYEFLLCDHAWSKKELQTQLIYFEKGFGFESTRPVENIGLDKFQSNPIPRNSGIRYVFPEVFVEEGQTYECKIPIHLTKPKPSMFCKKKKMLHSIVFCTIDVFVDNKDVVYEKLRSECDSLFEAFEEALEREEFCTNPLHKPSFDVQIEDYMLVYRGLRGQIRHLLYNGSLDKESNKYKQYQALLESLDKMEETVESYKNEKHDCGKHLKRHSCAYCKLSLREIYNRLNSLYMDLHNGTVEKSAIMKEVNGLYNCCKDPTCAKHAKQWKNGDPYKAGIIEYYEKIKNY